MSRCRGETGAALVEAAFVAPVLFYLLSGILEFGLLFLHFEAVGNMTMVGARSASIVGKDPSADYRILQAVKTATKALPNPQRIARIVVWHPSSAIAKITDTSAGQGCVNGTPNVGPTDACNVYTYTQLSSLTAAQFDGTATAPDHWWPGATRKDVNAWPNGADYIGVYIAYDHAWLTGLFGKTKQLSDTSVSRIEPHTAN